MWTAGWVSLGQLRSTKSVVWADSSWIALLVTTGGAPDGRMYRVRP